VCGLETVATLARFETLDSRNSGSRMTPSTQLGLPPPWIRSINDYPIPSNRPHSATAACEGEEIRDIEPNLGENLDCAELRLPAGPSTST
jgi:hypothetical protein